MRIVPVSPAPALVLAPADVDALDGADAEADADGEVAPDALDEAELELNGAADEAAGAADDEVAEDEAVDVLVPVDPHAVMIANIANKPNTRNHIPLVFMCVLFCFDTTLLSVRGGATLDQRQQRIGDECQCCNRERTYQRDACVVHGEAALDKIAKPAGSDKGRQCCTGDHFHRSEAYTGEQYRQCQGQFDTAQHFPTGHAHAARRFHHRAINAPKAGVGIDQHGWAGQDRKRNQRRAEARFQVRVG